MTEEQNNNEIDNTDSTDNDTGEDQNTDTDNNDSQDEDNIEEQEPASFDYDLILDEENSKDNNDSDDEDNPKPKKGNKAVDAINKMRVDGAVKNGITDFFNENPEAKQYKSMVEKFVNHPERMRFIKTGLPVSAVIAEALAPHQQRLGALKVKAADAEANKTKDGGSNPAPKSSGGVDYSKMSNSEISKLSREVMNGRYKG